jgi:alkylated DNA repair dioxygenase AlkB
VLLNLYRSGTDSMGFHADDEPELGPAPVIASVSLGAARTFVLLPKRDRTAARYELGLGHGSLLVMGAGCQAHYRHGVPKQRACAGERINLTFRHLAPPSSSP